MNPIFVGIEIGGTKLQIATSTRPPQIESRFRESVSPDLGAVDILQKIEKGLDKLISKRDVAGVGIGFGGPLDRRLGCILRSHQIKGWEDFPLRKWLSEKCQAPVFLENDANVAALAEATFGAGKSFNPLFYITLGSGVGAGLIVKGKIYHGHSPSESELGHIRLNRKGLIVENSCSGWAVDKKIRLAIQSSPKGLLASIVKEIKGPPAKALPMALEKGDPIALDILQKTAEDLAFGLSHVVHLQHPEAILFGGGLSLIGLPLMKFVEKFLPKYLMQAMSPPHILPAKLGEDVVPIGAILLAKISTKPRK